MAANTIPFVLLCLAASAIFPGQGENSKRTDDVDPLVIVVDKLTSDLLAVKAQLAAALNRITSLEAAQTPAVAFSAYISDEPHVQAAKGSAAPYRGVMANVGGGYNAATSAFTAPVTGQYFVIVDTDCSSDFRSLGVTVNGQEWFWGDNDGSASEHVTGSGIMTLQKGDVVTTNYYSNVGFLDAGRESTFSGFLVK